MIPFHDMQILKFTLFKKKLFVFDIDDKYRARLFWTIVGSLMGGSALLAVCVFYVSGTSVDGSHR